MDYQTRTRRQTQPRNTGQSAGHPRQPTAVSYTYAPYLPYLYPHYWHPYDHATSSSWTRQRTTTPTTPTAPQVHNYPYQWHAPSRAGVLAPTGRSAQGVARSGAVQARRVGGGAGSSAAQTRNAQGGTAPSAAPGATLSGVKLYKYYRLLKAAAILVAPTEGEGEAQNLPPPAPRWPGSRVVEAESAPEARRPRPPQPSKYAPLTVGLKRNLYWWLIPLSVPFLLLILAAAVDPGPGRDDYRAPRVELTVAEQVDLYEVTVTRTFPRMELKYLQFRLWDENGARQASGEIAIRERAGEVVGIESRETWEAKSPGASGDFAARAYDVENRADTCVNDTEAEGVFPVVFYDNDGDNRLSSGDSFVIRRGEYGEAYGADPGWRFEVFYSKEGDTVASVRLP